MSAPTAPLRTLFAAGAGPASPQAPSAPRSPVGTELGTYEPRPETRYWLKTCNDVGGVLVDYTTAVFCSQQKDAEGTLETEVTWGVWPTQDSQQPYRRFRLRPLTAAQAREWILKHAPTEERI